MLDFILLHKKHAQSGPPKIFKETKCTQDSDHMEVQEFVNDRVLDSITCNLFLHPLCYARKLKHSCFIYDAPKVNRNSLG